MSKKYYVVEVMTTGEARLMVKTLLKQQAYDTIKQLEERYAGRRFVVEIKDI